MPPSGWGEYELHMMTFSPRMSSGPGPPGFEVTQHPAVIVATAILAAGAVWHLEPAMALVAGVLGGALGTTSHVLKTGTRVAINASPEPFSNIGASLIEDVVVFAGLFGAIYHPAWFLVFLAAFVAAAILGPGRAVAFPAVIAMSTFRPIASALTPGFGPSWLSR